MDKQFMIFSDISGTEFIALDKKRMKIVKISRGIFEDITDECIKLYKRYQKKPTKNKKMGMLWYEFLQGKIYQSQALIYNDEVIIYTDDQKEFDKKLLEIRLNQLNKLLNITKDNLKALKNNEQYYTYTFNDL